MSKRPLVGVCFPREHIPSEVLCAIQLGCRAQRIQTCEAGVSPLHTIMPLIHFNKWDHKYLLQATGVM